MKKFLPLLLLFISPAHAQRIKGPGYDGYCDPKMWDHVYNPSRLKIIHPCVAVTGTIADATATREHPSKDGLRHEADGDSHGWIKLDLGQEQYINDGNRSTEGGNLVYEVVCMFKVKQDDAVSACKGYKNLVTVPAVRTHVVIFGSWVQDMEKAPGHAQHFEVHPVTMIMPLAVELPENALLAKLFCGLLRPACSH